MKRVRINVGKVGVVSKNGDYKKILTAGIHWLGFKENLKLYKMDCLYTSELDLDIMLKDKVFADMVEILDIKDSQIALKYINGNFESILNPGRNFYFKGYSKLKFILVALDKVEISEDIELAVLNRHVLNNYIRSFTIGSTEQGLLFIDGKFVKKIDQGTYNFWKNTIPIEVKKIDMRQLQLEISGQEILTKDKASLRVNFYAQYKVNDIQVALLDNKGFERQLYILLQLALREFIGTMSLDELLDNKDSVSKYILEKLAEKAQKLGVSLLNCGIRDVILPGDVKEIMNQVLIAQKRAQANIITRREETASTRSLLNTAKLMEDNTMLFKLKEMEYVEKIADKIGAITVSGGGQVVDQLKDIFSPRSK